MIGQTARRQRASPQPKIGYTKVDKWPKGLFSRFDADRVPLDGLLVGENVILEQDGTISPRPGLKLYGIQPSGIVLGQIYEFVYMNGTLPETWLVCMQNIGSIGYVTVNKNGGAWQTLTGKTYSATAKAHFEQVFGKILVSNGADNLSFVDIQPLTITPFTALAQPTAAPTVTVPTVAGFNGANITYRYRYTYSNQGETAGSPAATNGTTNKLREQWNGTTEFMTVEGTGVPVGTQRVNIYVGTEAGNEFYLDTVAITGGATTFKYTDTGTIAENPNRIVPVGDSTSGPKVTRITNVKGQVYMVGDTENPSRIWFGGAGTYSLDFSSYNGGGWVEPNKGGKDFPVVVKPFRDGKGTPMAVCFSKGTNGAGKRYLLSPLTTTLGTTTISYMSVQEDNGQDGTDSPDGVVMTNDGAWYPSRESFKTSNTKANIQNIVSTSGITDNIGDVVNALSSKSMDSCVGLVNDQRIYWAVPFQSSTNNQIWILDLRQNGAWMRPWYINADWMLLYADNADGTTKTLILRNNKIYQLDSTSATNDDGVAFATNINSGHIRVGENGQSANVRYVKFIFLRPQGEINISVTANTEDGSQTFSESLNDTTLQSVGALGAYGLGMIGLGNLWPVAGGLTVASARSRVSKTIEIDEECDYYSWSVGSTASGVSYQLAEVLDSKVAVGYSEGDN